MQRCSSLPQGFYLREIIPIQDTEANIFISQLLHLNTVYTTIIKNKEMDMKYQIRLMRNAKTANERTHARAELREIQSRSVDLYCYWLNELLDMEIATHDKCANVLLLMMIGNCHWFLAKYGHMRLRASIYCSSNPDVHFEEAIEAYGKIFDLLEGDLPKHNAFYVYLLQRYSQLVLDAKERINRPNESPETLEEDASTMPKSGPTSTMDVDSVTTVSSVNSIPQNEMFQSTHEQLAAGNGTAAVVEKDEMGITSIYVNGNYDKPEDESSCCSCIAAGKRPRLPVERNRSHCQASGNRERNSEMPVASHKTQYSKSPFRNAFHEICYFMQRMCGVIAD